MPAVYKLKHAINTTYNISNNTINIINVSSNNIDDCIISIPINISFIISFIIDEGQEIFTQSDVNDSD